MTSLLPLFTTVCVAAGTPPPALEMQQISEFYAQARAQLASGDTLAALRALEQLTEADPKLVSGWRLLGMALMLRASPAPGDRSTRDRAERALRRALALDPDNPLCLLALSQLMRKQSQAVRPQGTDVDADRLRDRAVKLLADAPHRLVPAELQDFQHLLTLEFIPQAKLWQAEFEALRRSELPNRSAREFCHEQVGPRGRRKTQYERAWRGPFVDGRGSI